MAQPMLTEYDDELNLVLIDPISKAWEVVKMAASHCNYLWKLSATNSTWRSDPSFGWGVKNSWLGATKLLVGVRPHVFVCKRRPFSATVSFSLPTAKPERDSAPPSQELPKWSSKAIKSFAMGELEARKLKYPTTGTEALLMGLLIEGTNLAAKFLRANGITLFKVRDETVKLLGKADMFFFSPEHPPLTEQARRALDWALDQKINSVDSGEITTAHLLLGIWSEVDSPGHKILSTFGFNDEKAKELESLISKPGIKDD